MARWVYSLHAAVIILISKKEIMLFSHLKRVPLEKFPLLLLPKYDMPIACRCIKAKGANLMKWPYSYLRGQRFSAEKFCIRPSLAQRLHLGSEDYYPGSRQI